jgi:hypothetical protein
MSKEQNLAKIKHAVQVKSNVQPAVGMTLMWLNVITVEAVGVLWDREELIT